MEKNGKATKTKSIEIKRVHECFNIVKKLDISKLEKEDMFKVLRLSNALRATSKALDEFVKDAGDRLKPKDWDKLIDKNTRFAKLTDDEKIEVNRRISEYQKDVDECVKEELKKTADIDLCESLSDEAISNIVATNKLSVEEILMLQDISQELAK